MAEVDELQRELLARQNGDGGWGYQNATSWTEPTALALLALDASCAPGIAHHRAVEWLRRNQRVDGGWPPNPAVAISTSVTSFALLALSGSSHGSTGYRAGLHWTTRQIKPERNPVERLEFWLGRLPAVEATTGGSPWFPGTAAWVAPTCMAILALSAAAQSQSQSFPKQEVTRAQEYLLSRRCFDGGWNHGGTQYLSERAESYPEMTGMALLALQGIPRAKLASSIEIAIKMQQSPGSSEGQSWLCLALLRHGFQVSDSTPELPWRTTRDLALRILALTAMSPTNKLRVLSA